MSTSHAISSQRTTGEPGERILRYTLGERVHHWLGALSYVYCLITGLAFWSPYLYWLAAIVGGGPTARFWHPWFGLAFTLSVGWMYKIWRGDMATTEADRRWKKAINHYIENDDQNLPPVGRFNYGQKLFFWLMFYGVILLLISGLGLWFVESIPVEPALAALSGGHGTRGRGAGDHWRLHHSCLHGHVFMVPRVGFTSIIRGEVSDAWASTHHRLWYEQVTKGTSRRKVAATISAERKPVRKPLYFAQSGRNQSASKVSG